MKLLAKHLLVLTALAGLPACSIIPNVGGGNEAVKSVGTSSLPQASVADTPVKIGNPYAVNGVTYTPADDLTYDEVGYASWYSNEAPSRITANGEPFNPAMISAAHKTLPLPSYVEVTSIETGKTILVRVNDRGPFVQNRIIDLSHGAAEQLGITANGLARVRVHRVYPAEMDKAALRAGRSVPLRAEATPQMIAALEAKFNELPKAQAIRPADHPLSSSSQISTTAPMSPKPASSTGSVWTNASPPVAAASSFPDENMAPPSYDDTSMSNGWHVQLGAFSDRTRADSIAAANGALILRSDSLWRVRLGPYPSEAAANEGLARARQKGYSEARIFPPGK